MRAWLRQQGEQVNERGAVAAPLREKYWQAFPSRRPAGQVTLMPGPDADDDEVGAWADLGDITPEGPAPGMESIASGPEGVPPSEGLGEGGEGGSVDPGPAHGRKDWRRDKTRAAPGAARGRPGRVTAGIRADIGAKISLALEIPGQLWRVRDPVCGGTFVEQRPEIADALVDIVCDSPDLVAFFTGPGGSFMKYLKLAAALYPVGTAVMAHHVYHSIEPDGPGQPADYTTYAA